MVSTQAQLLREIELPGYGPPPGLMHRGYKPIQLLYRSLCSSSGLVLRNDSRLARQLMPPTNFGGRLVFIASAFMTWEVACA